MTTAKSSLVSFWQDGKMLSCRRWFISILAYWINLNLILLCLLSIGFFNGSETFSQDKVINIEAAAKIDPAVILQNEINNWSQAKRAKYSKFTITFPENGMVHAKGLVPLGSSTVRVNVLEINTKLNPDLEIRPQTASN